MSVTVYKYMRVEKIYARACACKRKKESVYVKVRKNLCIHVIV